MATWCVERGSTHRTGWRRLASRSWPWWPAAAAAPCDWKRSHGSSSDHQWSRLESWCLPGKWSGFSESTPVKYDEKLPSCMLRPGWAKPRTPCDLVTRLKAFLGMSFPDVKELTWKTNKLGGPIRTPYDIRSFKCVKEWCVTSWGDNVVLCVKELCLTKMCVEGFWVKVLCAKELHVCVWQRRCDRVVCDRVLCKSVVCKSVVCKRVV